MRPSPVPEDRLLVLLYHNVGPPPRGRGLAAHWIEPRLLRAQIRYLRNAGHTFVDADWLVGWFAQRPPEVTRPTLLTFDDGLANLYEQALPVLCEEQVPALVFVVAGQVGGTSGWEPNPAHRHLPTLTWEQMREMQDHGVTFGSHTMTHPRLSSLPEEQWAWELAESKRLLEAGLGRPLETLAYPYGDFDERIADAAQEAGYRAAFSTIPGLNSPTTDRFALRRMNVRRWSYLPLFRRKLTRMTRVEREG